MSEKDNRQIETTIPNNSIVKSETNHGDKYLCVVCNQTFGQFELELHFLECIQDQSESQTEAHSESQTETQTETQTSTKSHDEPQAEPQVKLSINLSIKLSIMLRI